MTRALSPEIATHEQRWFDTEARDEHSLTRAFSSVPEHPPKKGCRMCHAGWQEPALKRIGIGMKAIEPARSETQRVNLTLPRGYPSPPHGGGKHSQHRFQNPAGCC